MGLKKTRVGKHAVIVSREGRGSGDHLAASAPKTGGFTILESEGAKERAKFSLYAGKSEQNFNSSERSPQHTKIMLNQKG